VEFLILYQLKCKSLDKKRKGLRQLFEYSVSSHAFTSWSSNEVKPGLGHEVHTARAYPGYCSIKEQEYFYSTLVGMLVHSGVTPGLNSPVLVSSPGWREPL